MSKKNKVDLRAVFGDLQTRMAITLSGNRRAIIHPGTKGDAAELHWLEVMNTYLPSRYQAARAFVIDVDGQQSEQLDVVIFDRQYSPFLFKDHGALFIPAESVYAVFEVKQEITKGLLEYAGKKIASVRRLRRTSAPISHAGGVYKPKPLFPIIGGILALESSWAPAFGRPFETVLLGLRDTGRLDIGCCVRDGAFLRVGDKVRKCRPEESLLFLLLQLLKKLQGLGTVPAIDFDQYLKALKL